MLGSPQSPMFFDEQAASGPASAGHPVGVALGSQSCAVFWPLHVTAHDEEVTLFFCVTQHTVPGAQFAVLEHSSVVGGS